MKEIKIETKILSEAISFANNFVAKNPVIDITKNLFISLNPNNKLLTVFGTNLQEGGFTDIEVNEIKEIDEITKFVLPKKILTVLKTIDDMLLTIKLKENESSITEVIFTTEKSEFKFQQTSNGDEFPALSDLKEINYDLELEIDKLKNSLGEISHATARQNNGNSPALENIYMDISQNEVKLITTDTYCLAYTNFKTEKNFEENVNFFITPNIASVIQKFKGDKENIDIKLIHSGKETSKIFYQYENKTVFNNNISAKFPNYNLVLETNSDYNTNIKINTKTIKPQLKRIKSVLDIHNESDVIQLKVTKDNIQFLREQGDQDYFIEENVDLEYEYEKDVSIHFSINYLIDFIKNIKEEEINLKLESPLNPIRIKQENKKRLFKGLIMPVRSN